MYSPYYLFALSNYIKK